MVVIWGANYTFGVFFKPVLTEFGWTRAATSGAYSLSLVLHGLLGIGAGRLTDRFGPRVVMIFCAAVLGLGYSLMSQISDIWQLYLFYGVIIAIGMGGSYVPMLSTTARWFVKRRGIMTGIVVAGIGTGTVIMPPLARWLISTYQWRTSYVVMGIMTVVLITLAACFLRRDPSQKGLEPYGKDEVEIGSLKVEAEEFSLRQALRTRQFWILCATFFGFGFNIHTIMTHIVAHATDLGISASTAANLMAAIGGLGIFGRVTMGGFADRFGNRLTLILCFTVMLASFLWLLVAESVWMLYVFAAVFGFSYGGSAALESPIVADLFGLSSHGVIMVVVAFIITAAGAVGPALAGRIFDVSGSYDLAFIICATLAAVSIIMASLLGQITKRASK